MVAAPSRTAGLGVGTVLAIFGVHAALRIGGMWQPSLVPLSMAIVWPLPWLLLDRSGRRRIGIRRPSRGGWLGISGLCGLVGLAACAIIAWLVFASGPSNWLIQHRAMLTGIRATMPADLDLATSFWLLTVPAMIFSPLGEELLYRGFLQAAVGDRWGSRTGLLVQATAFACIHLAHYGLDPFDPWLIALWIPSMFAVAMLLGWLAQRYDSLAPPILAHATLNLAMNWYTLRMLPALGGG